MNEEKHPLIYRDHEYVTYKLTKGNEDGGINILRVQGFGWLTGEAKTPETRAKQQPGGRLKPLARVNDLMNVGETEQEPGVQRKKPGSWSYTGSVGKCAQRNTTTGRLTRGPNSCAKYRTLPVHPRTQFARPSKPLARNAGVILQRPNER